MARTLFTINARGFVPGHDPRRHPLTHEERVQGGRQRARQQLAEMAVACGMDPLPYLLTLTPTKRIKRWLSGPNLKGRRASS